jgi:hypothetical protein
MIGSLALAAAFLLFMAALVVAYVKITRAVSRGTASAIHAAATPAPRTFTCQHLSISGVVSASCGVCGPLP